MKLMPTIEYYSLRRSFAETNRTRSAFLAFFVHGIDSRQSLDNVQPPSDGRCAGSGAETVHYRFACLVSENETTNESPHDEPEASSPAYDHTRDKNGHQRKDATGNDSQHQNDTAHTGDQPSDRDSDVNAFLQLSDMDASRSICLTGTCHQLRRGWCAQYSIWTG